VTQFSPRAIEVPRDQHLLSIYTFNMFKMFLPSHIAEFKWEKKEKKAVDDLLSHLNLSSILVIAVNFQMRLD